MSDFSRVHLLIVAMHERLTAEHERLSADILGRARPRHHEIMGACRVLFELSTQITQLAREDCEAAQRRLERDRG